MDVKKLAPVIVAFIILIAAIVVFFLSYTSQDINPPKSPSTTPTSLPISPTPTPTPEINTFQGNSLSFNYPKLLTLEGNEQTGITLSHKVQYPHQDPCDFSEGVQELEYITDFKTEIRIFSQTLEEVIINTQSNSFVQDNLVQGELQVSPGFIDEVQNDNLSGFRVTQGVEGCGKYDYYYPKNGQILHLVRYFIPELNPISSNSQEYLKIEGIIPPEQETLIFDQIISSIKLNSQSSSL